jgi:hypothetical protein
MVEKKQGASSESQVPDKEKLEWMMNIPFADIEFGKCRLVNGYIGDLRAPSKCTGAQFSRDGMVGVYRVIGDEEFKLISTDFHKGDTSLRRLPRDPV